MTSGIYFGNNSVEHGVMFYGSSCYEGRGSGR